MPPVFHGFDVRNEWDYENGFYLTSHLTRIGKLLAQYDVFRRILELPGAIVECGVFKGASLIRLASFRDIYESAFSRKVIGFDSFEGFPMQTDDADAAFVTSFEAAAGTGVSKATLEAVLDYKSIRNVELVPGDICETVPAYLAQHPELRVALLHIDVDVYEPARVILENLYPRIVRGGVVMIDNYATTAGETKAVDEFFHDMPVRVVKASSTHIPAYVVKP